MKLHQEYVEELEEFEAAKKFLERKAGSDIDFISVLVHMPGYLCRNTACMFHLMLIEEEAWYKIPKILSLGVDRLESSSIQALTCICS